MIGSAKDETVRRRSRQGDYVRAHGALYNVAAKHREHAAAVVEATRVFDADLPLLCQVGTET